MISKKVKLGFVASLVCLFFTLSPAQSSENAEIDNLAEALVSSPSSAKGLLGGDDSDWKGFFAPHHIKNSYPWIQTYLDVRGNSLPSDAVAKWVTPIIIGFGLPNNLDAYDLEEGKSFERPFELYLPDYLSRPSHAVEAAIYSQLKYLLPELRNITAVPISISKDKKDLSNLRIVFVQSHAHWESPFKKGRVNEYLSSLGGPRPFPFRRGIESMVPRYEFTPGSLDSVDGSLIVNERNEIILSTCYIWAGHSSVIIQGLVTECVIRSLGITRPLSESSGSLLNGTYTKKNNADVFKLSEQQKLLLAALYNPQVAPGMDKASLIEILKSKQ